MHNSHLEGISRTGLSCCRSLAFVSAYLLCEANALCWGVMVMGGVIELASPNQQPPRKF